MPPKKKTEDAKAPAPKPKKAAPKKAAPSPAVLSGLSDKEKYLFDAAAKRARLSPEGAIVALLRSHLRKGAGVMTVCADMRRFSR